GLLVPTDQRRVRDGLGKLRNLHLDTHGPPSMLKRASPAWTFARAYPRPMPRRRAPAAGERAARGCRTPAPPRSAVPRRKVDARRSAAPAAGAGSDTTRPDSAALPGTR